jgi:peptidoglycan/LPS O-acetylase OafA/YrhL
LLDYLRKRVLRIYPAFAVATAVAALVLVPLVSADPVASLKAFNPVQWAMNALRLKDYVQTPVFLKNPFPRAVNGALWSIPYEFWCYLGIALLGMTGMLRRRRLVAIAFALSIAISIACILLGLTPGGRFPGRMFYPPRLLPYYLAGTVFYLFRERICYSGRVAWLCGVLLIPAAFLKWGVALVLPVAGTYLLFWVAFHPAIRLHHWAKCGDFSYGIYLYAFPIQQLLVHLLGPMHPLSLFAMATPLSILAGAVSWHAVEKHGLRLKPHGASREWGSMQRPAAEMVADK